MKTTRYLVLAIAVAAPAVSWPVLGEPADTAGQPSATKDEFRRNAPPRDERWRDKSVSNVERLGSLERSSKLIGATVKDSAGEKHGKIKDLAVDLESGRVLEVILSSGGVLGVGEKLTAIPPSMVTSTGAGEVSVSVDTEKLKNAPAFEFDKWSDATTPGRLHTTYRYYSVDPYYLPPENYKYSITPNRNDSYVPNRSDSPVPGRSDSTSPNRPDTTSPRTDATNPNRTGTAAQDRTLASSAVEYGTHWGKAERASKIVGQQVTNDAGEKVGKVDDLLVDLAAGRVTEVIVSSGGFLGVGDELSGIPPSVFRYDMENGKLALHASKDQLTAAPRFKSDEYGQHSSRERVDAVYKAYNVTPYYDSTKPADNTARNVRDRNNRSLTPIDQGNNEADTKMTADIRRSVTRESNLSLNARNVKIITLNGRVTLRGPVNTAAEKDRIEEIAHRVAGVDMVDSQIEVRGTEPENK